MSSLNARKQTTYYDGGQTTHNGAAAVKQSIVKQLERSVMANMLWEDSFYEEGESIANRIANLVKENRPDDVAIIAHKAKHDMKLRHTPLFLARELFRYQKSRKLAGTLLSNLISRPDDVTEFLAMYWKDNKDEPLANQAKDALAESLAKFSDYQIKKYKRSNAGITLRDAFRIVHPKPTNNRQAELWEALVAEKLVSAETWESLLSAGGNKKAVFEGLINEGKLGGLALLRNLRGMREAGVDIGFIKQAILDVKTEKLFPMQLVSAWRHNPQFTKELEQLFMKLFTNQPKVSGATAVLVDISGSMVGTKISAKSELDRRDAAAALAMIAREMFVDVDVYPFESSLGKATSMGGFGLIQHICSLRTGGTNIGLSVREAFALRKYDRILVITDEQSSDSVDLPKGAKGYMMNVGTYKNGIGYGNWTRIDGFSAAVLDYIVESEKL